MSRYARQIAVQGMGAAGQARLAGAHLLVVGAGGLAAPALQYLAGAGIGRIRLVDPDCVEDSNLHRQTLFRLSDRGRPKAVAAAETLTALNPDCRIEPLRQRLDPGNVASLSAGVDLILDCADSFAASYVLSDHAQDHGLPLISASALGLQGYAGGFCGGAPSLRAVFPALPRAAGSCASEGVLGPVVGTLGCLQAQMALAHLAGLDPSPLGRIVSFDAARFRFGGFDFGGAPEPARRIPFIAAEALRPADLLIDLRAPEEGPPLRAEMLRLSVDEIGPDTPRPAPGGRAVMCCRSGLRAWAATERLAASWDGEMAMLAVG
ncbi:HesA/MoeB/ThiF family protein [Paracoccus marinaquae]|uniref:HesA/MoeB/ThiF family protein n=1 Tax=Paracoccus marinaquae TaxID=2841926 RepID=A0ABS6AFE1_9RHOB|nr:HesA/MoeB/ThiF family protein [Paracoccus marinaquae]MBU3028931.1 HesA/MoeB/ThiF family protein [Paracoccus marinaquae]